MSIDEWLFPVNFIEIRPVAHAILNQKQPHKDMYEQKSYHLPFTFQQQASLGA